MNLVTETPVLICLSAGKSWFSRFLRRVMRCQYNHASILYRDELWGGWWVVQVDERGVQLVPVMRIIGEWLQMTCFEYILDLTPGLRQMKGYVGARYDWKALVWGVIRLLVKRAFGWAIERPWHEYNRMTCSEFAAGILKSQGIPGTETWEPSSVSPADLLRFMVDNSSFRNVEWPI